MSGGGEILRAMLTKASTSRRIKTYTVEIAIPAGAAGASPAIRGYVRFDAEKVFLLMNICAGRQTTVQANSNQQSYRLVRQSNQQAFSLDRILTPGNLSSTYKGSTFLADYEAFYGDEYLTIETTRQYTTAQANTFQIMLSGIEYSGVKW